MHREPMARLLRAEAKTPLVTGQVADQAVAPRERELMTAAPVRGMTVATGSCVPKVFAPAEPVKQPAVLRARIVARAAALVAVAIAS